MSPHPIISSPEESNIAEYDPVETLPEFISFWSRNSHFDVSKPIFWLSSFIKFPAISFPKAVINTFLCFRRILLIENKQKNI